MYIYHTTYMITMHQVFWLSMHFVGSSEPDKITTEMTTGMNS